MKTLWVSIRVYFFLAIVTGIFYPVAIAFLGKWCWPEQATGSVLKQNAVIKGSLLIAESFTNEKYFWPRPSAVTFETLPSGASQLGGESLQHLSNLQARADELRRTHPEAKSQSLPADLLTASASGLDPDLSPEAIYFQFERVALARKFSSEQKKYLRELIDRQTVFPTWGIIGETTVNVLSLNLALDQIK